MSYHKNTIMYYVCITQRNPILNDSEEGKKNEMNEINHLSWDTKCC